MQHGAWASLIGHHTFHCVHCNFSMIIIQYVYYFNYWLEYINICQIQLFHLTLYRTSKMMIAHYLGSNL